jgi:CBS domain containing-hemolysin-like protein
VTWLTVILVTIVGLFLSGFFSGAETGLYCVNRLRVELAAQQNDRRAKRLTRLLADEQGALSVTLIGTNVSNYLTTTAVAYTFANLIRVGEFRTELYTVIALTPIVFVFGEVTPKNLFQRYADQFMPRVSGGLMVADAVIRATGAVWVLKRLAVAVTRLIRGTASTAALSAPKWRVAHLLREALAGQSDDPEQLDLIQRVCDLSDTPVLAVMVPRNLVRAISADADRRELERIARRTAHTRLCVYQGRQRYVLGIVHIDELLRDQTWATLTERLEPAPTLSPHETVASALNQLRRARRELAVVTDASGRMLGIVTFTDLLRELIGDVPLEEASAR